MPLQTLSCDTLGDLHNGFARAIIDAALASAVRDVKDRGAQDEKKRKVVITVLIESIGGDGYAASVEATAKLPSYKIPPTVALEGQTGDTIQFRADSPANPYQQTINDFKVVDESEEHEND